MIRCWRGRCCRCWTRHILPLRILIFSAVVQSGAAAVTTAMEMPDDAFLSELGAKHAAAEKEFAVTVRGKEGWLFFADELRHLSVGRFWGTDAARVSRANKPSIADPLPAILDFKAQLDEAGIELLLVPVPAKATIYPEMISDRAAAANAPGQQRVDVHHRQFYDLLESKGVRVLDLTPLFLEQKNGAAAAAGDGFLYCRQDTHWSGRACVLAARRIAEEIRERTWLKSSNDGSRPPPPRREFETFSRLTQITGDLWEGLEDSTIPKEELPLTFVRERKPGSGGLKRVEPWRQSPVLLLGDSHDLVFHAGGDMLAEGAGLPEHLARELGFPVDVVAVRGSGATPARINLQRRRDNLAGKRLIIWCFSVREFTESDGWAKVSVIAPPLPQAPKQKGPLPLPPKKRQR